MEMGAWSEKKTKEISSLGRGQQEEHTKLRAGFEYSSKG